MPAYRLLTWGGWRWVPYCTAQLGKLRNLLDDQEKKETGVLAVAIDSNADLQKMADKIAKDGKTPNVVSDPGHWMIDRYEIWNPCVGGGI